MDIEYAFTDKKTLPTDETLHDALKEVHGFYLDMLSTTSGFDTKWTFYKGWTLKIFSKKKALCYIIPCNSHFHLNMAIRPKERDAFLADPAMQPYHQDLSNSEKFMEGYAMRFKVTDKPSYDYCKSFVERLVEVRG